MTLISLAYVSSESRKMTAQDIEAILEKAREKNAKLNITGMLLYRNGYFIQALEGEEEDVVNLYNTIAKDERHSNVLMVGREDISERSFSDWSMGFRDLEDFDAAELQGYTDFLDQPYDPNQVMNAGSRAVKLLELFKEGGRF
jgi:hypothetical protein